MIKKIILLFCIISASALIYLTSSNNSNEEIPQESTQVINEEITEEEIIPKEISFLEEIVVIDGQAMYYTYPKTAETPELIVYSHGQLQRIVQDLNDPYMLKIQEYGKFFASKGFAFSASNQHDDNWGQKDSLNDIAKSIKWFEENNYPIQKQIYLIGFSMGGLATINYAIESSQDIKAIALLAPTPSNNINQSTVNLLKEIPIKIWHGTDDINIPFTSSQQYVKSFESYGKEIDFVPIENAQHYDIEISLIEDILEFFKN